MAAGQHVPIAVRPERLRRVVAQMLRPQLVGHRRQGHRRAGMAAVGRLDGVHRQRADRVDGRQVEVLRSGRHRRAREVPDKGGQFETRARKSGPTERF